MYPSEPHQHDDDGPNVDAFHHDGHPSHHHHHHHGADESDDVDEAMALNNVVVGGTLDSGQLADAGAESAAKQRIHRSLPRVKAMLEDETVRLCWSGLTGLLPMLLAV